LKHLEPFFRWRRAIDIDVALVESYQRKRQAEGAENATINREVCTLQHSLKLAVKQKKLSTAPTFEKLPENNIRQGFLSFSDFDKIFTHVEGQWRRNTIEFAFLTGWRSGRVGEAGLPLCVPSQWQEDRQLSKAWYTACGAAGYGKILPHDFRRSLARNLSRRGVSIPTITRRAGWKTLSTFTRYNVTDLSDQEQANNIIDQARTA